MKVPGTERAEQVVALLSSSGLTGPGCTAGSYILLLTILGPFKCPEPGGRGKMKGLERYSPPTLGGRNKMTYDSTRKQKLSTESMAKTNIPEAQDLGGPGWLSEVLVPTLSCTTASSEEPETSAGAWASPPDSVEWAWAQPRRCISPGLSLDPSGRQVGTRWAKARGLNEAGLTSR